jgi:hypothetical protein
MRPKTPAQKALTSTAVAVLETDPQALFVAEVKVVARERIVRGQRFTPADVATVLEAYRGEVIPDAISEWAISGLRDGALGEVGRPGTSVHDKAALRVAHREYKALLPIVQADTGEPGPLLDEFRPKRWWKGPPSERAFQLVVWRYRHLLPDRETVKLRRLIRVRQYEK